MGETVIGAQRQVMREQSSDLEKKKTYFLFQTTFHQNSYMSMKKSGEKFTPISIHSLIVVSTAHPHTCILMVDELLKSFGKWNLLTV